ncbi:uncharacterized protein LOC133521005 isoform X1 [Cydia pomonella]|uniref:uncharacterized protein LOC133521005 isoform X1 n=1 Tax=Cydia pomonella TaxID=82600 RepID=UPI002ADE44EC|nr:uncharacterized protein LOC133521005 isoform X1 [Cydia pomonella]
MVYNVYHSTLRLDTGHTFYENQQRSRQRITDLMFPGIIPIWDFPEDQRLSSRERLNYTARVPRVGCDQGKMPGIRSKKSSGRASGVIKIEKPKMCKFVAFILNLFGVKTRREDGQSTDVEAGPAK